MPINLHTLQKKDKEKTTITSHLRNLNSTKAFKINRKLFQNFDFKQKPFSRLINDLYLSGSSFWALRGIFKN